MATPGEIAKQYRDVFLKSQLSFNKRYRSIFNKVASDFASLVNDPNIKFSKSFQLPPSIEMKIVRIIADFQERTVNLTEQAIEESWDLSNKKNDKIAKGYLETIGKIKASQEAAYFMPNLRALKSFISRKRNAGSLSDTIWKTSKQLRSELEAHLGIGIANGDSANVISQRIRQYLENPEVLFRRVRDENGKLIASKAMREYHPGQGVYKSAYKNAMRITRSETNMAYLTADHQRWLQLDMVIGVKINLSAQHPDYDFEEICEVLEGTYPKEFYFPGWHPQCYSDDTEVYTKKGWKLFKDLSDDDLILSLNKDKNIEWTNIVKRFSYYRNQEMIRFHNKSLDLLVTPDHKMIYVTKDGNYDIRNNKTARDYSHYNGGLFRGCKYVRDEKKEIRIGSHIFKFDLFAEFLGYYLSEGSFSRKYCIVISQDKTVNPDKYEMMYNCLENLGFKVSSKQTYLSFWDKSIWQYVQKFGKSQDKFIPEEIKDSGVKNIKSFLKAFNLGDGSIRPSKIFTGNRGGTGLSKPEVYYSTSSKQMADDLGELVLKAGRRPSFSIMKTEGELKKFRNGFYRIKNDQTLIRECRSMTATVFKKEVVKYDGFVYDIELEKNHILYVRRMGKCTWGSNCLCNAVPVLMPREDFKAYLRGERPLGAKQITDYPQNFIDYWRTNFEKVSGYKSPPYVFTDNMEIIKKVTGYGENK